MRRWQHVAYMASESEPDLRYEIKIRTSDHAYGCDCTAYRFARRDRKTCKHIEAWLDGMVLVPPMPSARQAEPARIVSSSGEAYVVTRRSISFGAVPGGAP